MSFADNQKYPIKKCIGRVKPIPPDALFKIFDCKMQLYLLYDAEIWGTIYRYNIEKVHSKFCKFVLGVGYRSPNKDILPECDRYPLRIDYKTFNIG